MLNENKFSKYLLYAIGEILLVVIGILIALQINNWNLNKIEKRQEFKILQDLKVEFQANHKEALRIYNVHVTNLLAIKKLQEESELEIHVVDSLLVYLFNIASYTPKPGASNSLINSGKLSIITNKELRNELTTWSGIVEDLYDDEDEAKTYTIQTITPFLAKHYPIINLEIKEKQILSSGSGWNENQEIPYEDWYSNAELKKDYNLNELLKNLTFQSHISAKKLFSIHCASEATYVINAAEKIVNLIDFEINDYEKNNEELVTE